MSNALTLPVSMGQEGIKPAWEDSANAKGGKWSVQLPRGKYTESVDNIWLYTVRPYLPTMGSWGS